MKKMILVLLVLMVTASFALADSGLAMLPHGIAWGDPMERLFEVEGEGFQIQESDGLTGAIKEDGKFGEFEAETAYAFFHDRLVSIMYAMDLDDDNIGTLVELLTAEYGAPGSIDRNRFEEIMYMIGQGMYLSIDFSNGYSFIPSDDIYMVVFKDSSQTGMMIFNETLIREIYEANRADDDPGYEPVEEDDMPKPEEVFRLTFHFDEPSEKDLTRINEALSGLALSNLSLENKDDYIMKLTHYYDDNHTQTETGFYGFDSVTLVCEQREGAKMYRYQIETILDEDRVLDSDMIFAQWKKDYPDRCIRSIDFHLEGESNTFVVMYTGWDEAR